MEFRSHSSGVQSGGNDKIIRTAPPEYCPEAGLGFEYFKFMKRYKNHIAQYIVGNGDLEDEQETYGSLLRRCIRTSLKLQGEGLTSRDVICLCTYNHKDSCVPFIACTFSGIVVASLDPTLSPDDTAHLLKQVTPKKIFVVPEAVELIERSLEKSGIADAPELVVFDGTGSGGGSSSSNRHRRFSEYTRRGAAEDVDSFEPKRVPAEDTAVIFFSSGTTGLPKGICQHSLGILCQGQNCIDLGIASSVSLFYSSLYWISSVLFMTTTVMSGGARVVCRSFDPSEIWLLIHKYKVSMTFLAPIQALAMCKVGRPEGIDTSSLQNLITGGGPLGEKHLAILRDYLPGTFVYQGYGQTEVAGVLTCFNTNRVRDVLLLHKRSSSCGRPIPGIWYKIVDPETNEVLGPNRDGELCVKSRYAMNGYHNMDSSSVLDQDGWLRTGDIVRYDDDLCFYVVDRAKEMLKVKSWHVAPAMLEAILAGHPAVKKAVVVGIPHEEDGDHPTAIVALHDEFERESREVLARGIEEYVSARVQDIQRLRGGVRFVEGFALTPSGKVKRQEVRRRLLSNLIE